MNLKAELKNVSDIIVSGIKSVSFEVFDEFDTLLTTSDKVKSKVSSLLPGQDTKIEFHNRELQSKNSKVEYGRQVYGSLQNFNIIWRFQCEDTYGNVHYYKAQLYIKDSNEFVMDLWKVEKVG